MQRGVDPGMLISWHAGPCCLGMAHSARRGPHCAGRLACSTRASTRVPAVPITVSCRLYCRSCPEHIPYNIYLPRPRSAPVLADRRRNGRDTAGVAAGTSRRSHDVQHARRTVHGARHTAGGIDRGAHRPAARTPHPAQRPRVHGHPVFVDIRDRRARSENVYICGGVDTAPWRARQIGHGATGGGLGARGRLGGAPDGQRLERRCGGGWARTRPDWPDWPAGRLARLARTRPARQGRFAWPERSE